MWCSSSSMSAALYLCRAMKVEVTCEVNEKLDVSKKAAKKLGFVNDGETEAKITVLDKPDNK